ncbi:protein sld2 [Aspergillus melleus]|uniref:protein sld2 n=1 Tax=Aspergillus melleus TaxID=138277 RepID=UPI001E8CF5AC|nr:uncharacterized protein LDX57_004578 [Aspergillus melleus]KAH8426852.1 hypothetical protein LDX57_004578 [Aspergillus melleus]
MADVDVSEIATLSGNLRAELKEWERAFAAANEGRKAERNDIKQEPEIAAKYKEYSRLKSLEKSTKYEKKHRSHQPQPEEHRPTKRKHASPTDPGTGDHATTPRKATRGGLFETPAKSRKDSTHPSQIDPYDSPSVFRRLFSPSAHMQASPLKAAIGPTPQRDGKALGLFDLLSESGGSTATPSATRIASVQGANAQTPSKRRTMDTIAEEEEEDDGPRGERTPASSGKMYMLSTLFATPTTLRYAAMVEGEDDAGHADAGKQHADVENAQPAGSETPSFLRRSNSGRYGLSNSTGNAGGFSPMAVRKPPKLVGRGLSAIVQGLRDMEDERMQDDMDVLDEIEAEEAAAENVQVNDSQAPTTFNGRPYKKKGQKRTTRRVNMKPVVVKPQPQPQPHSPEPPEEDDDDEGQQDEPAAVPETQGPSRTEDVDEFDYDGFDDIDSLHTMSEPDLDSDPEYGEKPKPAAKSKSFSEKMKEAIGVPDPQPRAREEKAPPPQAKATEAKKPRERKVNPQAHANYRSLKIRSRGSRGRGAGRFGRRR